MAPPGDKSSFKSKSPLEMKDGKQKIFSLRWIMKRSKSSKFPREGSMTGKIPPSKIPASKSCDTGLKKLGGVDRYSTFLLWRLLPPAPKEISFRPRCRPVRTSFSCSDVQSLVPIFQHDRSVLKVASWNLNQLCEAYDDLCRVEVCRCPHRQQCKLCLGTMDRHQMYVLKDCHCRFCETCLRQYILYNIRRGNIYLTCPDANCGASGQLNISEIKQIAGEDALQLFQRFKLNLEVDLDPNRVWCPRANCETVCTLKHPSTPGSRQMVDCPKCFHEFCSSCKLSWHGKTFCEKVKKRIFEEIEAGEEAGYIKRCPSCRVPIQKDEGCAQMMCYRCKHVFCWHCLTSLDDDFLLRHYDKGPCRNKLGHSRASMVWHRTQVVGIFAGFTLMLLVASPILLFAAPCLLCCRCRDKFIYFDEPTPL